MPTSKPKGGKTKKHVFFCFKSFFIYGSQSSSAILTGTSLRHSGHFAAAGGNRSACGVEWKIIKIHSN